jgi:hypothetical protein
MYELLFAVVLGGVALAGTLVKGGADFRRAVRTARNARRRLKSAARAPLATAAPGRVLVHGDARAIGGLRSPITGEPAVGYRLLVRGVPLDATRGPSSFTVERTVAFELEDGDARALVRAPWVMDLSRSTTRRLSAAEIRSAPEKLAVFTGEGIDFDRVPPATRFTVREWLLRPGTRVAVLGALAHEASSDGYRGGFRAVLQARENEPLMVTDRGEFGARSLLSAADFHLTAG